MQVIRKRFCRAAALYLAASQSSLIRRHDAFSPTARTLITARIACQPSIVNPNRQPGGVLAAPWFATQLRGAKSRGADLRPGNVIQKKGKTYQVVKAQHTTQGRGGAIIQVELRDIESGSKINERLRTDEVVEKVYVEERSYKYLFTDDETGSVVLMEPDTFTQLDIPKHLFGESLPYLQEDMKVSVQLYDEKPMSASVPTRVTCTVVEAQVPMKGIAAAPHEKKVLLDNGLAIQAPAHIVTGDRIVVNTIEHSYLSRS